MNKLMKILAFMTLFAMMAMLIGAVSADSSNGSFVNTIQSIENGPFEDNMDNYGATPPRGDICSGFAVEVNDTGYGGIVHKLTKAQYKEMWNRISKWQKAQHTTKLPNYVTISDMKVGVDKVTKDQFLNMEMRWNAWKSSHNGQEPSTIGIEGSISGDNPSQCGPIQNVLMAAVGPFHSFTGFYNLCKNRKYSKYLGNKYSRNQAIQRLRDRSGLNCVDVSQLGYALAKEMGYEVKFQETWCPIDNIGHVLLKIKGKEFNSWKIVDLAACINSGRPLGFYWCNPPHDSVHNWVE